MPHAVLIGESILDNAAYTRGGPDVVTQVRDLLPPGWEATLLAVDGSTTDHAAARTFVGGRGEDRTGHSRPGVWSQHDRAGYTDRDCVIRQRRVAPVVGR